MSDSNNNINSDAVPTNITVNETVNTTTTYNDTLQSTSVRRSKRSRVVEYSKRLDNEQGVVIQPVESQTTAIATTTDTVNNSSNNNTDSTTPDDSFTVDDNYVPNAVDDNSDVDSVALSDESDIDNLENDAEEDIELLRARLAEQERQYMQRQCNQHLKSQQQEQQKQQQQHNDYTLNTPQPQQTTQNIQQDQSAINNALNSYTSSSTTTQPALAHLTSPSLTSIRNTSVGNNSSNMLYNNNTNNTTTSSYIMNNDVFNPLLNNDDIMPHVETVIEDGSSTVTDTIQPIYHDAALHEAIREHQQQSALDYNTDEYNHHQQHNHNNNDLFYPVIKPHPTKHSRVGERYQAIVPELPSNIDEDTLHEQYIQSLSTHDSVLEGYQVDIEYRQPTRPILKPGQQLPITRHFGLDEADYEHLLPPLDDDEEDYDEYDIEQQNQYNYNDYQQQYDTISSNDVYGRTNKRRRRDEYSSNNEDNDLDDVQRFLRYVRPLQQIKQLNSYKKHQYKVAIVGCNVSGLCAARELLNYGFDVELYDVQNNGSSTTLQLDNSTDNTTTNNDPNEIDISNIDIDDGGELYRTTEQYDPIVALCHELDIKIQLLRHTTADSIIFDVLNISAGDLTQIDTSQLDLRTVQIMFINQLRDILNQANQLSISSNVTIGELWHIATQNNTALSQLSSKQTIVWDRLYHQLHHILHTHDVNALSAKHFGDWWQHHYIHHASTVYRIHGGKQHIINKLKNELHTLNYRIINRAYINIDSDEHQSTAIITTNSIQERYDYIICALTIQQLHIQKISLQLPDHYKHIIDILYDHHSHIISNNTTIDIFNILQQPLSGECNTDIKHEDTILYNYLRSTVLLCGGYTEKLYYHSICGHYLSGIRQARQIIDLTIYRHYSKLIQDNIVIDSNTSLSPALFTHHCILCRNAQQHRLTVNDILIGPFKHYNSERTFYTHYQCLSLLSDILHIRQYDNNDSNNNNTTNTINTKTDNYYSVANVVDRSRYLLCNECNHYGATVSCHNESCNIIYHTTCVLSTGWSINRSDQSNWFYCNQHRPYNIYVKTENIDNIQ